MPSTIQGLGLLRADAALAALVEDPEQLYRDRERFGESPPSYRSQLSHNSTLSQPTPRDEEQQRLEDWQWKVIREHRASWPRSQFDAQASEEYQRLEKPRWSGLVFDSHVKEIAEETTRKRWVEQGIWDDRWGSVPPHSARWMHEQPLQSESDLEEDVETSLFSFSAKRTERQPPRPNTDEKMRLIAEQCAARARERDASRPFHQFFYQVSKERERIEDEIQLRERAAPGLSNPDLLVGSSVHQLRNESNAQEAAVVTPPDINTMAYERVKDTWMNRGIWYRKWGVLPGMSWKHEQYIKDLCREEMGDDFARLPADAFEHFLRPSEQISIEHSAKFNQSSRTPTMSPPPADISGDYGAGKAPPSRNIFRAPTPAESSHDTNASPRGALADEPTGFANGDADHALPVSNSQDHHIANGVEHPLPPRRKPQRRKKLSDADDGQGQEPVAAAALGPLHPSRISKNRGNATSAARQRRNSPALLSEAEQSSHGLGVPISPPQAPVQRRRSERLRSGELKIAGKTSSGATAGTCVGDFQSRPKRTRIGLKVEASAKTQGVSQKKLRTTRRKAK